MTRPPPSAPRRWVDRMRPSRTRCDRRSSSGPMRPYTNCEPKSTMSPSHHTTRSPLDAASERHRRVPLAETWTEALENFVHSESTTAPARVRDERRSRRSTRRRARAARRRARCRPADVTLIVSTMRPIVVSSLRAGRHTEIAHARLLLDPSEIGGTVRPRRRHARLGARNSARPDGGDGSCAPACRANPVGRRSGSASGRFHSIVSAQGRDGPCC